MVTVFGLGFVGLTTALGFAHMGSTSMRNAKKHCGKAACRF